MIVKEYTIIERPTRSTLVALVKTFIADGWQPLGSHVYNENGVAQTMVKYQAEPGKPNTGPK